MYTMMFNFKALHGLILNAINNSGGGVRPLVAGHVPQCAPTWLHHCTKCISLGDCKCMLFQAQNLHLTSSLTPNQQFHNLSVVRLCSIMSCCHPTFICLIEKLMLLVWVIF